MIRNLMIVLLMALVTSCGPSQEERRRNHTPTNDELKFNPGDIVVLKTVNDTVIVCSIAGRVSRTYEVNFIKDGHIVPNSLSCEEVIMDHVAQ